MKDFCWSGGVMVLVLAVLMVVLAMPVGLAQEPVAPGFDFQLPDSAAEGVNSVALWLAALAGLSATALVEAIKGLPLFRDEERAAIAGPAGNLVAAIISVLTGYAIGWLGMAAGLLDQSGVWQVLLFTWPMAKGWFESGKLVRR